MGFCKCCGAKLKNAILEYKNMPNSAQGFFNKNDLKIDKGENLKVYQCKYCNLVQLSCKPVNYYKDVIRATGFSVKMKSFRMEFFRNIFDKYNLKDKKILEIGCGCGEYMKIFETATNTKIFGIENSPKSVKIAKENGLNVYESFIEDSTYEIPNAPYDFFYILNFLEHIPNPKEFLRGIYNNLSDDAIGLIEVPNFDMMVQDGLYSEFIKDHLTYFTKETLKIILENSGFYVESCEVIWDNYIISAIVKKRKPISFNSFNYKYQKNIKEINKFLESQKEIGDIVVWGAGHQSLANLSLLNLRKDIKYVIDSADFKQGKFTPTTHLPIVSPDILKTDTNIKTIIIMAGGYSKEIYEYIKKEYRDFVFNIAIMENQELKIIK